MTLSNHQTAQDRSPAADEVAYRLLVICPDYRYQSLQSYVLNLYAIYARYGTINILLPFTDLLRNARPYGARPASFSSHLLLRS